MTEQDKEQTRRRLDDRNLSTVAERIGGSISYSRLRRWYLGNETALKIEEIYKVKEYLEK